MLYTEALTFRKHTRNKTRKRIRLVDADGGEIYATTLDISETGLFIDKAGLLKKPSIGEQWIADFYALKGSPKKTSVKVVRESAQGIGFLFS